MASRVHLVMMTHNRFEYTKLSLPRLLANPSEQFDLTIWDNSSNDGTKEFLQTVSDRRIVDIVFSDSNKGQAYVTNKVWSESSAQLVGKVDNDCLVTPGWTEILTQAHEDLPNLAVVGCWHFSPDEFDYERAKHKIQQFGKHKILRHPWIDGSALLVKRKVYMEHSPCRKDEYLSGFWKRLALAGYINGFYYPLIYQEHMDYPWSEHFAFSERLQEGFKLGVTARNQGIRTVEDAKRWHQVVLQNIIDDPWDVKHYVGWRGKLRRIKGRLANLHDKKCKLKHN